jgi:hypothetical protein
MKKYLLSLLMISSLAPINSYYNPSKTVRQIMSFTYGFEHGASPFSLIEALKNKITIIPLSTSHYLVGFPMGIITLCYTMHEMKKLTVTPQSRPSIIGETAGYFILFSTLCAIKNLITKKKGWTAGRLILCDTLYFLCDTLYSIKNLITKKRCTKN